MKPETLLARITNILLNAPYNLGALIVTGLMWYVIACMPYHNNNFDMISEVTKYMVLLSVVSIGSTIIKSSSSPNLRIMELSILGFILWVLTLLFTKSVLLPTIGLMLLPVAIFCSILLLKEILQKEEGRSKVISETEI